MTLNDLNSLLGLPAFDGNLAHYGCRVIQPGELTQALRDVIGFEPMSWESGFGCAPLGSVRGRVVNDYTPLNCVQVARKTMVEDPPNFWKFYFKFDWINLLKS